MDKKNIIKTNKKYFKLAITLFSVVVLSIIFYRSSESFNLVQIFKNTTSILSPFICGIIIAYILNPLLKVLENKSLTKIKNHKLKRTLSITLTYIILIGFSACIIIYIIPAIIENGQHIVSILKDFDVNNLNSIIDTSVIPESLIVEAKKYLSSIISLLINIPSTLAVLILNTAYSIVNFILGVIISIYILTDKENLLSQIKKITYAIVGRNFTEKSTAICLNANEVFEKYFVGKIIDSTIIGIIFFVGSYLLKAPYSGFLSLIIGVTNMIPYFGPIIGGVPVVLITLIFDLSNPLKALWICIFVLALQIFDGNILGPKILGDSVGLKPLSIIFSITVGGALFGFLGMFFGVPIFAVIMSLFKKYIDNKYKEKSE